MITNGIGLDSSLLASGGLGQSVLPMSIMGSGILNGLSSGIQLYSYGRAKDTILWTYGARHLLDKAAQMNFTIVLTPGHVFDIDGDLSFLRSARTEGIGVAFDVRTACENWTDPRWQYQFEKWILSIKDEPALRYIMPFPDVDGQIKYIIQAGDYSPIANLQSVSIAALIAQKAPNVKTLGTFTRSFYANPSISQKFKYLGRMNLEGISTYTQWAGNDERSPYDLATAQTDIDTFTTMYAPIVDKTTTSLCLWLQGFQSTRLSNTTPIYSDWVTLWNKALSSSDRWNSVGFYAWQPPGKNVIGIGNSQLLQDDIAWFNANVRAQPFIAPAKSIVKAGNQFTFASSLPNVVWALLNAPSGTIINQNGTVTTGAIGGRCEVAIYPAGSVPSSSTPIATAILYVDKEP